MITTLLITTLLMTTLLITTLLITSINKFVYLVMLNRMISQSGGKVKGDIDGCCNNIGGCDNDIDRYETILIDIKRY